MFWKEGPLSRRYSQRRIKFSLSKARAGKEATSAMSIRQRGAGVKIQLLPKCSRSEIWVCHFFEIHIRVWRHIKYFVMKKCLQVSKQQCLQRVNYFQISPVASRPNCIWWNWAMEKLGLGNPHSSSGFYTEMWWQLSRRGHLAQAKCLTKCHQTGRKTRCIMRKEEAFWKHTPFYQNYTRSAFSNLVLFNVQDMLKLWSMTLFSVWVIALCFLAL